MFSLRTIGILWVIAGFGSLFLASAGERRNTPLLVLGMIIVAVGAAMIRRAVRRKGDR